MPWLVLALVLIATTLSAGSRENRHQVLSNVSTWFYHLGFNPSARILRQITASDYDMVVMEPIFTEAENQDFPIRSTIQQLKSTRPDRIVLAYIDIGQAEEWRYYWQPDWQIGNPAWIVANDPDGWEGNYPVAYWHPEWQRIWLSQNGAIAALIDAGFDGIYLDWVEAYSDENVIYAAQQDGVNPQTKMIQFVQNLAKFGRTRDPDFIVIGQNAAELWQNHAYARTVDAIAQEQVWYDGSSDNSPKGDCPLPATNNDIETIQYISSLSRACRRQHNEYPDSTLHVSTQEYIEDLRAAQNNGLVIFTVDYAIKPANISRASTLSRSLGFKPFVSERDLDVFYPPR